MVFNLEGFIYLFAGLIIIIMYIKKKRKIPGLNSDLLPELDREAFINLKILLETLYERTLYLGIVFLLLAYVTFSGLNLEVKALCILVIIGLVIYNILPRNKVMKILISSGISLKTIKDRGVRL